MNKFSEAREQLPGGMSAVKVLFKQDFRIKLIRNDLRRINADIKTIIDFCEICQFRFIMRLHSYKNQFEHKLDGKREQIQKKDHQAQSSTIKPVETTRLITMGS